MMKTFVAFAVLTVAVTLAEYSFEQPFLPCSLVINYTKIDSEGASIETVLTFNGIYCYIEINEGGNRSFDLYRSDIHHKKDDKNMISLIRSKGESCEMTEMIDPGKYFSDFFFGTLFGQYDHMYWDRLDIKSFHGKTCDYYYNDDDPDGVELFVYDHKIYGVREKGVEKIFEYEYTAPKLSEFVVNTDKFPACSEVDSKVFKAPTDDSTCHILDSSQNSSAQTKAIAAVVFAFIVSSLIVLF